MNRSISSQEQREKHDLINMFNKDVEIKTASLIIVPNELLKEKKKKKIIQQP